MSAVDEYSARVDAADAQTARLRGGPEQGDRWAGGAARWFRLDPHRPLDGNLAAVAGYIQPDDVVIDVGGGAGRVCLPLALRCRAVVNVDPSPDMCAEFEACAAEAHIANARVIHSAWPAAEPVLGDVVLAANVTYFVREIAPFIRTMEGSARRRVILMVWSVPPPAQDAALFRAAYDEEQRTLPGHRQLLPVLWEMGILPDVRVLPEPFARRQPAPQTREEAVASAMERLRGPADDGARRRIESHFDELFTRGPEGFLPRWRPDVRELLITWESGARYAT